MERWAWLLIGAALAACGGDEGPAEDAASDAAAEVEVAPEDTFVAPTAWSEEVTLLPVVASHEVSGDLADGAPVDLDWADEGAVACWLFTQQHHFDGAQVFYALDRALQTTTAVRVEVTSEPGVDVNLYAYALPTDGYFVPPDVPRASACEARFQAGPGETEAAELRNIQDARNWFIAVAGPDGATAGGYTLTLTRL